MLLCMMTYARILVSRSSRLIAGCVVPETSNSSNSTTDEAAEQQVHTYESESGNQLQPLSDEHLVSTAIRMILEPLHTALAARTSSIEQQSDGTVSQQSFIIDVEIHRAHVC